MAISTYIAAPILGIALIAGVGAVEDAYAPPSITSGEFEVIPIEGRECHAEMGIGDICLTEIQWVQETDSGPVLLRGYAEFTRDIQEGEQ